MEMKGIMYCAECAYYSMEKHKCTRCNNVESDARKHFYDDCPLEDVIPVVHGLLEDDPDDPNRKIKDAINELSLWREAALRHCLKNVTNNTFAEAVTVAIDCLKEKIDTIS